MKFLDMRNRLLWTFFFIAFSLGVANANPVTITFSFNSKPFSFDFGNESTIQKGFFTYDDSNPISVFNGIGFLLTDFQLDALSFDPARDAFWVPAPGFDTSTIEVNGGNDDQWALFDEQGILRFTLFAVPDGQGGFTGEISGDGGSVPVSFSAPTAQGSICPCFSANELIDDIGQIQGFAADVGATTSEQCEARVRFNDTEIFGFLDVTAIEEPDDTFTNAFVGESIGLPQSGTFCEHNLFLLDNVLHPKVLVKNLDDNQAQACLVEILKAYTKSQSKDKK